MKIFKDEMSSTPWGQVDKWWIHLACGRPRLMKFSSPWNIISARFRVKLDIAHYKYNWNSFKFWKSDHRRPSYGQICIPWWPKNELKRSDCTIQTAWSEEAYPEIFINLGWPQVKWIHHLSTWPQGVDDIFWKPFF